MPDASRWITVGDLAEAFEPGSNSPPRTEDLVGRTLSLYLENGQMVEHRFETGERLVWKIAVGEGEGREVEATYFAAKVREGIYFVDFIKQSQRATTVTLLLDLSLGIVTVLIGELPEESESRRPLLERAAQGGELTAVNATFLSGSVNAPLTAGTPRHSITRELVGRRVEYTYSRTERYEHIYLNQDFYTWHCLLGSEKGLADTDRCHYYRLGDGLYLFAWREKIVPTLGVVAVDFDRMRTVGKIFGYQGVDSAKLSNFAVGARARLLNVTERDWE